MRRWIWTGLPAASALIGKAMKRVSRPGFRARFARLRSALAGRRAALGTVLAVIVTAGALAFAAFPGLSPAAGKGAEGAAPPAPPPMQVGVDAVTTQPLAQTDPVIGRLVARRMGVVAARINGPIGEFRVEVGDRVKGGDVIVQLVVDALKSRLALQAAEVRQYAAAAETGQARIKLRRQELARLERLRESAAFSQARLDDKRQEVVVAESELAEARGRLASARAKRKLAEINLHNATVRAPYGGVVSRRHIEVGAYVNVGEPVVTLVDDRHLEIEADVPANRISGLAPGSAVAAQINGGPRITARVRAVVPNENPQTRTRTVRFVPEFPAGLTGLASNQSVTLRLPSSEVGSVVSVHKDAILNRKGATLVFVVRDGAAAAQPVRLGEAVGTRFIVLAGLKPGDLVVVRGNERLRPGQKVMFKAPGAAPQGKAPDGAPQGGAPTAAPGSDRADG